MKQVLCLFFLFLLCFSLAEVQAQTYANVPGAENVLVVFNELDSTSVQVKNYYQQSRGIPAGNVAGLYGLTEASIACAELENFT